MTGLDFASLLRRQLNDTDKSFSDGDILDLLNLGLLELGRELLLWSERWEFEANYEGVIALPDRFLLPVWVKLNGERVAIKPDDEKADEFGVTFEGFEMRTAKSDPLLPPLKYEVFYRTYPQLGDLSETLPIATQALDLLIAFCALRAKERNQTSKTPQELQLRELQYLRQLERIRPKLRLLNAGKNLRSKLIVC
ncbi:MAG: hypothetical protein LBO72_11060 [Helicobacteraceae bacterium]|jgi:hypothetical protein|nr:hypothetical protein [Helicobacteraceae bacterium]